MNQELAIQEIQAISLEILHTVAELCEAHNFRYSLIYGTLIGAVRHRGYIPWDDDVDIMMPRPDYDRFLAYLKLHISEYPHLQIFNPEMCPDYPYMITRISDDRYTIVMENEKPCGMGIFIDIYPYDGLGNNHEEALKYALKGDRLSSLCYQATRDHFAIENTTSPFRKLIKFPAYIFAKVLGKRVIQNKLKTLAGLRNYDNSEYVGPFVWLTGGERSIFLRKWLDETVVMPFGKYEFRVPKAYDEVLRQTYGDYMQLPPEKDRVGHHFYKVYEK